METLHLLTCIFWGFLTTSPLCVPMVGGDGIASWLLVQELGGGAWSGWSCWVLGEQMERPGALTRTCAPRWEAGVGPVKVTCC